MTHGSEHRQIANGSVPGRIRKRTRGVIAAIVIGLLPALVGCQQMSAWIPPALAGSRRSAKPATAVWTMPRKPLSGEQRADVQIALAHAAELRGDFDHALEVYEQALQVDGGRADVHHRMARLYDRKGDYDKALASYQKALALAPANAEIHGDLAYCYYLRQQYQEAEKSLLAALSLQPDFPRAHINYGLLLARTGREQEALSAFAQAGVTESQARVNLAFAMLLDQRYQEASQQLQAASDLDAEGLSRDRIAHLRQGLSVAQTSRTVPQDPQGLAQPATY